VRTENDQAPKVPLTRTEYMIVDALSPAERSEPGSTSSTAVSPTIPGAATSAPPITNVTINKIKSGPPLLYKVAGHFTGHHVKGLDRGSHLSRTGAWDSVVLPLIVANHTDIGAGGLQ